MNGVSARPEKPTRASPYLPDTDGSVCDENEKNDEGLDECRNCTRLIIVLFEKG